MLTLAQKKYAGLSQAKARTPEENSVMLSWKVLGTIPGIKDIYFLLWENQVFEIKRNNILTHWHQHDFDHKVRTKRMSFKPLPGTTYPKD